MPPTSRGADNAANHDSHESSVPPTLKPFLDNLPVPASLSNEPAVEIQHDLIDQDVATPTKAYFELGATNEDDDDDDDEGGNDGEGSQENDEFESHYSRQSSPASEASDDVFDSESTQPLDMSKFNDSVPGNNIQRVSSLPLSPLNATQLQQPHLQISRSTTALHRVAPPLPPPLYPPFYNRPPTPLPPSPSLTSLLRPPSLLNRSTTSTRPTTPDSSDVETPNDTEAAVAHSARKAHPPPPTAPKVPTYEYYGFVLYLASSLAFLIYICWSYLPSPFLHALGVTYYPNRWWSLAIPAWIVMVLIYIYVALACFNVEYLTLGLNRLETIVDDAGNVAILDEDGRLRKGGSKKYVADLEEKRRREAMSSSWSKKRKNSGKGSRADKKKHREDEWSGYAGSVTDQGVASGLTWKQIWNEGTDAVMDIPLGGVCEVLYGSGRDGL